MVNKERAANIAALNERLQTATPSPSSPDTATEPAL